MPYPAIPSDTLAAAIRQYLGLTQAELAAYLGVTRAQVAHAEAGRRVIRGEASRRLGGLARLLPAPIGPADTEAATPEPVTPATGPLRRRLARCIWEAANRRAELLALDAGAAQARRWQAVLPALRALLPAPDSAAAARQHRRLADWAARAGAATDPEQAAARVLLTLRIRFLAAEAAALRELLSEPADPVGSAEK
ncbi:helix-turn-helix transcriptional regulator [Hymenobacter algoricola]|uniref:HTH cro/C1-type domain-containing protein n=1 Tax=Hymenobacter algoricola TaxID=486267 RepID=A0ABP7N340_9BACT